MLKINLDTELSLSFAFVIALQHKWLHSISRDLFCRKDKTYYMLIIEFSLNYVCSAIACYTKLYTLLVYQNIIQISLSQNYIIFMSRIKSMRIVLEESDSFSNQPIDLSCIIKCIIAHYLSFQKLIAARWCTC